jgi:hypothetical protein
LVLVIKIEHTFASYNNSDFTSKIATVMAQKLYLKYPNFVIVPIEEINFNPDDRLEWSPC